MILLKIIKPQVEIIDTLNEEEILKKLELIGRVCYKSEELIKEGSAGKFIKNIIKRGHESVIEHFAFSVKFVVDRGISHEIVRHRIASYSQESTRYCNYGNKGGEITVILPLFFDTGLGVNSNSLVYDEWKHSCEVAERKYLKLLEMGAKPEEARAVLPTSLKTELVMTANLREWRHFLKLRTSKASHPQIREVADMLLEELQEKLPTIFEDL